MTGRQTVTAFLIGLVCLAVAACPGSSTPTGPPSVTPPPNAITPPSLPVVLVGAGDIASCNNRGAEATAKILDQVDGLVFTTGDNVYETGTPEEFAKCYESTWGRHKARTRPSLGNHEMYSGGGGYYGYFGDAAGPAGRGYYSYDHGAWKVISLNSEAPAGPGSPQALWLQQELQASTAQCTVAYWHHPVFSSGYEGDMSRMKYVWRLLYEHRVELVLSGHSHNYERLAPQNADGQRDMARGIRIFVVGTGGNGFTALQGIRANSEAINDTSLGVLKLTLASGSYSWEFLPVAGGSYHDSGTGTCF